MRKNILFTIFGLLAWAAPLLAQPMEIITYQGRLKDNSLPANGNYAFAFDLCDAAATDCYPAPEISQNFLVTNGLFKSTFTLPSVNLFSQPWYLRVSVGGTPLTPMERLTFVPYSVYASTAANSLSSVRLSGDVMTGQLTLAGSTLTVTGNAFSVGGSTLAVRNGNVGIGTAAPYPYSKLHVVTGGTPNLENITLESPASNVGFALKFVQPEMSWGVGQNIGNYADGRFQVMDLNASAARLTLLRSGNLGVGSTEPPYLLSVSSGAGEAGNIVVISTGASEVIRMTGGGEVYATRFIGDGSGITGVTGAVGTDPNALPKAGGAMTGDITMGGKNIYAVSTVTASGDITAASYQINGSTVLAVVGTSPAGLLVGRDAGKNSTVYSFNTLVGNQAGYGGGGASFTRVTAVGDTAGLSLVSGSFNSLVGVSAGYLMNSGEYNTVMGALAGYGDTIGSHNVVIGHRAGYYTSSGSSNTLVGDYAGYGASGFSFSDNTLLGANAGYGLTSGSRNILIGVDAGKAITGGNGNLVIGNGQETSFPGASGEINIGGLLFGDTGLKSVGISTRAPQGALDVYGIQERAVGIFRSTGDVTVALQSDDVSGRKLSLGFNSWSASQSGLRHMSDLNSEANGDVTIYTTNAGSSSGIERLRITAAGRVGVNYNSPQARLDVLAEGVSAGDLAQIWRDSSGAIVSSVSATGQMQAVRFIGDGSGLTNVAAVTGVDNSKLAKAGDAMQGTLDLGNNYLSGVSTITMYAGSIAIVPPGTGGSNGGYGISIGSNAYNNYASGTGVGAGANDNYSFAVGVGAGAATNYDYGVGAGAFASSNYNNGVGVGYSAYSNFAYGVGVGANSNSNGLYGVGVGANTGGNADYGLGLGASASGNRNYAAGVGAFSQNNKGYGSALGAYSYASSSSTALGAKAKANAELSLALGYGTVNDSTGTASFGNYALYSSSSMGIGGPAQQARLDVQGANGMMTQVWRDQSGVIVSSVNPAGYLQAVKFIGDGSGLTNVAAVTGTDNSKLAKAGDTMTGPLQIQVNGAPVAFQVGVSTFVVKDGLVGINTSAPLEALHVGTGNIRLPAGQSLMWGSPSDSIYMDGTGLAVLQGAVTRFWIGSTGGYSTVGAGDISGVQIDTTSALHVVAKGLPTGDGRVAVFGDLRGNGSVAGQYLAAGNFETTVDGPDVAEAAIGLRAKIRRENAGGGLVTNAYGLLIDDLQNGAGTIGKTYGIYIGDQTSGAQSQPAYALYSGDADALSHFSGNLGIGVQVPASRLEVQADSAPGALAQVWRDPGGAVVSSVSAAGYLQAVKFIGDGSGLSNLPTSAMTGTFFDAQMAISTGAFPGGFNGPGQLVALASDGKLGLGTASPSELLHVYNGNLMVENTGGPAVVQAKTAAANLSEMRMTSGVRDWSVGNAGSAGGYDLSFQYFDGAWSKPLVLKPHGALGVMTSAPAEALDIYDRVKISTAAGGNTSTDGLFSYGLNGMDFRSNGNTYMRVAYNATNVGIGGSVNSGAGDAKLQVKGSLAVGSSIAGHTGDGVVVQGRVGIGTAAPSGLLEVRDQGASNLYLVVAGTGTAAPFFSISTAGLVAVGYGAPSTNTVLHAQAVASNFTAGEDVMAGLIGSARALGTGPEDVAVGGDFRAEADGNQNVGYLAGLHAAVERTSVGSGMIDTAVGLYIEELRNPAGPGGVNNTYGIYIATQTSGVQTNRPYAIYSADSGARTYFAGKTGIGNSNPSYALEVSSAPGSSDVILAVTTGTAVVFGVKGNGETYSAKFVGDGSGLTNVAAIDSSKLPLSGGAITGALSVQNDLTTSGSLFVSGNANIASMLKAAASFSLQDSGNLVRFGYDGTSTQLHDQLGVIALALKDSKVGIGNSAPTSLLHLTAANPTTANPMILAQDTAGGGEPQVEVRASGFRGRMSISGGSGTMYLGTLTNSPLALQTNSQERIHVTEGGYVGLGLSATPFAYTLDVSTANGADAYVARFGANGVLISTGGAIQTTGTGNGPVAGNARGNSAVDLQSYRDVNTQVASGNYSSIGGGIRNSATFHAATVSGGQFNRALSYYATVGGGNSNQAGGHTSLVAGGAGNTASGQMSAVTGGESNQALAAYSFAGAGYYNVTSGSNSVIAGGSYNTVTGTSSVVAGGEQNKASGMYAGVLGGNFNTASGIYSGVLSGSNNQATFENSVVAGGRMNDASGSYAAIGGGFSNIVQGSGGTSTIAGGEQNIVYTSNNGSAIGGGTFNNIRANGNYETVSGGYQNTIYDNAWYSSIAGGGNNVVGVNARASSVGGGSNNRVYGSSSTVAGGSSNVANSTYAFVGGGSGNTAYDQYSAVVGGMNNYAGATASFVGGGTGNNAGHTNSAIAGGQSNNIFGLASFVGGGEFHTIDGQYSAVAGGSTNKIRTDANYAFIGGGAFNISTAPYTVIGGGLYNTSSGTYSGVFSGHRNEVYAVGAVIAGGEMNYAGGQYSFVGAGQSNQAPGNYSAIAGGVGNSTNFGQYSFIGAGTGNLVSSLKSAVGGGDNNQIASASSYSGIFSGQDNLVPVGINAFIGGGYANAAQADFTTVSGGVFNYASAYGATVAGGGTAAAAGQFSMVAGGSDNTALGDYSFAAGRKSSSTAAGTFTWSDSLATVPLVNNVPNQVMFKASGGFWVSTGAIFATPGIFVNGVNDVGMGTAAPAKSLHIKNQAVVPDIRLERGLGGETWDIGGNSGVYFNVSSGGTSYLTVTNTGKVGIGATPGTTGAKLQVGGDLGLGDGTETGNQPVVVWLRNSSAGMVSSGSIVVVSGPGSFTTTTSPNATNAIGVTYEPIAASSTGRVAVAGVAKARCNATVALGSHVVTSANPGQADGPVSPATIGASIGIWMEACTSPAMGMVLLR